MTVHSSISGLFATVVSFLAAAAVAAQENQPIYWPMVTDGTEYRRVAYPREAGEIAVLADTLVVLDVRQARVDYWPITREYLTDVGASSPEVEGKLEVVRPDGTVQHLEPEPYIVWYPEGVGAGPAEIFHGLQAAEVYEAYVRDARAAAEAIRIHQRLVAEHHAAVEAWLKIAAEQPAVLPPPPPEFLIAEPEPYRAFATEPQAAVLAELPAGAYTLRLRAADGSIVPGTERRLVSSALSAIGIGYVIRPGDRWNQPAISFSPDQTIYTTGRSALYLQPLPVAEFPAFEFTRLFRPQSVEATDPFLTVWVPRPDPGNALAQEAQLQLWEGAERISLSAATAFRVTQTPGRSRGYEIEEFVQPLGGALEPDFSAIRIANDAPVTRISLMDSAGQLAGSERKVRVVTPVAEAWLFLLALFPLLVGLLLQVRSALRSRRPSRSGSTGPAGPGGGQDKQVIRSVRPGLLGSERAQT